MSEGVARGFSLAVKFGPDRGLSDHPAAGAGAMQSAERCFTAAAAK